LKTAIFHQPTLDLASKAFESYEATEMVLGIDLKKMGGILEMSVKDEIVGLEVDEVSHKFIIKMRGLAYTMSLLDPASIRKLSKIPKLDLPGSVTFRGEDLRRGIKATGKVGDYAYIGISGKGFFIEGIGDTDSVKLELTRDEVIDMIC
jgi:proliferating cell nuclear antigen